MLTRSQPNLNPTPIQLPAVPIGRTPLRCSRLGLGTHSLHREWSSRRRQDILALAFDVGYRYFDTAPSYGAGLAERAVGRFARSQRSGLVLTTKFGIPPSRLATTIPGWLYVTRAAAIAARRLRRSSGRLPMLRQDFRATHVSRSVEHSLRRLATDRVEILYLHEPTVQLLSDADALLREIGKLKAAGKIRYVGLSGNATHCLQVAQLYPAMGEVLQLEIPKNSPGLPDLEQATAPPHSVHFWEFSMPVTNSEITQEAIRRLYAATISSLLMLSTRDAASLRCAAQCANLK